MKDDCPVNKTLRGSVKAFLRSEEKKRQKIDGLPIKSIDNAAPAADQEQEQGAIGEQESSTKSNGSTKSHVSAKSILPTEESRAAQLPEETVEEAVAEAVSEPLPEAVLEAVSETVPEPVETPASGFEAAKVRRSDG